MDAGRIGGAIRGAGKRALPPLAFRLARRALALAVKGGWVQGFDVGGPPGDETIVVAADCAAHPVQVHAIRPGTARRIERFNDERMARVALGETREVTLRERSATSADVRSPFRRASIRAGSIPCCR